MVKVYLSRKGVPFSELNVSIDSDADEELRSLGRSTTPVTVIGDHQIVGYKPRDLEGALIAEGLI
jgi:glutaredoxin